jgi:cytochrome b subunit of formate dehydrogenase
MSQVTYRRFSLDQRIEHAVALGSFVVLAVTGLPQKWADANWAQFMIGAMGGIETVRVIHRVAATALMLETVYHLVSVGYRFYVRRVRLTMLPTLTDMTDAWHAVLHNLGLRRHPPQGGRFTFAEKAEYWAFVWGAVVMVLTGFMLWNPIATTRFLPGQFIPAAKAAHGGEALLAVLAIIIWHMWHVHVRQFNRSMFTGHISEHAMLEEHARELADIKAGIAAHPVDPVAARQRSRRYVPVAAVVAVVLLLAVVWFVSFEQTALATVPPVTTVEVFVPQTPTPLPPTPTSPPVEAIVWNGYVSTLLEQKCTVCHGTAAGLSFGSYADALSGGRNGPVILPGNSAESPIVLVQSASHPGQLSAEELERIKLWIDAGAPEE